MCWGGFFIFMITGFWSAAAAYLSSMNKSIAFFDFDGTITTRDSFLEIIRFTKGNPAFLIGFLVLSPWILFMRLGLLSNSRAKERVMQYFFGGLPEKDFKAGCERFTRDRLPSLIRVKAMEKIREHQQNGCTVVVVSASPRLVLETWCIHTGIECIATELELINERVTGNIRGKNCHGPEKVRRIRERFALDQYDAIYAYGDSPGDKPLLALANFPNYKPFRD
jgi:phosphatidylglycerophosphatase C